MVAVSHVPIVAGRARVLSSPFQRNATSLRLGWSIRDFRKGVFSEITAGQFLDLDRPQPVGPQCHLQEPAQADDGRRAVGPEGQRHAVLRWLRPVGLVHGNALWIAPFRVGRVLTAPACPASAGCVAAGLAGPGQRRPGGSPRRRPPRWSVGGRGPRRRSGPARSPSTGGKGVGLNHPVKPAGGGMVLLMPPPGSWPRSTRPGSCRAGRSSWPGPR